MRIVVVTTSYPDGAGDASGHFVRAHARELAREHAADVRVVALGASRASTVESAGDGRVLVEACGGEDLFAWPGAMARVRERPVRLLAAPGALRRARRAILRSGPFDRAVAHWMVPSAFPLLECVEVPLEVVSHGADVRLLLRMPHTLRAAIVERVMERAAVVRFVAVALRDLLVMALPARLADRVRRVATVKAAPMDVPPRAALVDMRPQLGLSAGEPYAAWVGRLVPGKRPGLAVAAARAAGIRLVVAGDGPELLPLQREEAQRRSSVLFAGRLPREEALGVVAGASVLLHTSEAEGAPTVVREARALGVPVVACAAGDLAVWSAADAGIVLAEADAGSLALALRQVLRGPAIDPMEAFA